MSEEPDTKKALRQHLEMDMFFTGDFALKGQDRGRATLDEGGAELECASQAGDVAVELEKIARQVRDCCQCGLGESRTNAVPGEGDPNAQLVFVGEAPGADEDRLGEPFVGRGGQLLDRCGG